MSARDRHRILLRPPNIFESAIEMLEDRGAAFDPFTAIDVTEAQGTVDDGMMDVAADHPVDAAPAELRWLEPSHIRR